MSFIEPYLLHIVHFSCLLDHHLARARTLKGQLGIEILLLFDQLHVIPNLRILNMVQGLEQH